MGIITLVSYIAAVEGYTFFFTGGSEECRKCRLRKVCIDKLRKGHVYRVTKVMNIRNQCPINKWVVTVEVEEVPVRAAIPKKYGVEGLIFHYRKIPCGRNCPNKEVCSPQLLPDEAKVKVIKVYSRIKCRNVSEPLVAADVLVVD